MTARAAGEHRRTPEQRRDQRLAWDRSDEAFFAAGACHVLAWTALAVYADRALQVRCLRVPGRPHAFHTYAVWQGWALDASGWNPEDELVAVNEAFEGVALERLDPGTDLAAFCAAHEHRMPADYWDDPVPRARAFLRDLDPPWDQPITK